MQISNFKQKNIFIGLYIVSLLLISLFVITNKAYALTVITTCQELQDMANNLAEDYELGNDIDCTNTVIWNAGAGFAPIGIIATPFTGTLDGNGYKVYGLTIDSDTGGIFGAISSATISNLGIVDIDFTIQSDGSFGALSSYGSNVTISSVYATGSITGSGVGSSTEKGGLVGVTESGGTIINSYTNINYTDAGGSNLYYGGLVGASNDVAITKSYAVGSISADDAVYAIAGLVGEMFAGGSIQNSYTDVDIVLGNTSGAGDSFGGIIGYSEGDLTNVYSRGLLTAHNNLTAVGGLIGTDSGATTTSSYWDTQTSGQATSAGGTGKTTAEMKQQATYVGWDFNTIWNIDEGETYPYFSFSPGFTLSETTQSVSETGTTDTFTVVLNAAPNDDVVITLTSADTDEVTVSPATLIFTSINWDTAQTVTVTGIDDVTDDGDQSTAITVAINDATSDDPFDDIPDKTVTVTTADDDETPTPAPSPRGTRFGCKDPNATNYNRFSAHRQELCEYENVTPFLYVPEATKTTLETMVPGATCPFFSDYAHFGERGDKVKLIQTFLKTQGIDPGPIDGNYGEETNNAIKQFQARYSDEILKPWNLTVPTGWWYQSTRFKANRLAGCDEGSVVLDNGVVVR